MLPLTEKNLLEFCQGCYFNRECTGHAEFMDDLKRVKYIKRLLQKIYKHKTLKAIRDRLILNHIIVLRNVFGEENAARILFFGVDKRLHPYLKSFTVYLEFAIKDLPEVNYSTLKTDPRIDKKLAQLEAS